MNKEAYRTNRAKGLRGQGEKLRRPFYEKGEDAGLPNDKGGHIALLGSKMVAVNRQAARKNGSTNKQNDNHTVKQIDPNLTNHQRHLMRRAKREAA